jgi:hypothetical protein
VSHRVPGATLEMRLAPGARIAPPSHPLEEHFSLAKKENPHTNLQSKVKESSILKKLIEAIS